MTVRRTVAGAAPRDDKEPEAVHGQFEAIRPTHGPQILGLYDVLRQLTPGPMVTLNRIVAVAMVQGPRVALDGLGAALGDQAQRTIAAWMPFARICSNSQVRERRLGIHSRGPRAVR